MKIHLLIMLFVISISGCEEDLVKHNSTPCFYPDLPETTAPDWVCHQQNTSQLITEMGMALASSAGITFSKNMAIADARIKLSKKLQSECKGNQLSEVTLEGSRVLEIQRSPSGAQFVQVGINPAKLNLSCRAEQ